MFVVYTRAPRYSQAPTFIAGRDQPHFRDGHWPESRRRRRAGSGQRRRPELRPRHGRGRPVDQSGSRAACSAMFAVASTPPLSRPRTAAVPASCSPGRCSAAPRPRRRPASWSRPPGRGVAVEISAVPLMSGERVVGVFGLIEERPDDTLRSATPASHPPSGRGASSSGAGPLDQADRRRAPPEHRDSQEPHPPSLSRPRRPFPTRSRRRRPGRITRLIEREPVSLVVPGAERPGTVRRDPNGGFANAEETYPGVVQSFTHSGGGAAISRLPMIPLTGSRAPWRK